MRTTKENKKPTVVAVSGGFDPIHIGHIRLFEAAKKLGDKFSGKNPVKFVAFGGIRY